MRAAAGRPAWKVTRGRGNGRRDKLHLVGLRVPRCRSPRLALVPCMIDDRVCPWRPRRRSRWCRWWCRRTHSAGRFRVDDHRPAAPRGRIGSQGSNQLSRPVHLHLHFGRRDSARRRLPYPSRSTMLLLSSLPRHRALVGRTPRVGLQLNSALNIQGRQEQGHDVRFDCCSIHFDCCWIQSVRILIPLFP
jgi:hypothetical protein